MPRCRLAPRPRHSDMVDMAPSMEDEARERLGTLCREAVSRFGPLCFWWADRSKLGPATILRGLRENGGHEGLRCASQIEEAMRAVDRIPVVDPPASRA